MVPQLPVENCLEEFAQRLESMPNETVDYTDSVVGMRHRISLCDVAAALRCLCDDGDRITVATRAVHELRTARWDDDVRLSQTFHAAIDLASAYWVWLKSERKADDLAAFELEASDCLACLQHEIWKR